MGDSKGCNEKTENEETIQQRGSVKKVSRQGRDILGEANCMCKGPLAGSSIDFLGITKSLCGLHELPT